MKSPARCAAWLLPLLLEAAAYAPRFTKPATPADHGAADPTYAAHGDLASVELPAAYRLIPGKPLENLRVHDETEKPLKRHEESFKSSKSLRRSGDWKPDARG